MSAIRITPALFLFAAGATLALSHLANEWVSLAALAGYAWKCAGIVLLGLFALARRSWLAGLGLLFCAAGDVLLEIVFVYGMAAFAIGHLFYIAAFLEWGRVLGFNRRDFPVAVLVTLVSAGLLVWFLPGMGDLTIPAIAYQVIITVMVASAFLVKAPMLARLGAVMFMLSDSLIALDRFTTIAAPPGSVWITYAAAQILIAWGMSHIAPYRDRAKRQPAASAA